MRLRFPERMSAARREAPLLPAPPPGLDHAPRMTEIFLASWQGRLFLICAGFKLLVGLLRRFTEPPAFVELLSVGASIGLAISVGYFAWRLFVLSKRRLLWRVRRRLILSYVFMGVVPALLIITFFLICALVVSMNISAYLFNEGYNAIVDDVGLVAQAAATEIGRDPRLVLDAQQRSIAGGGQRYAGLSTAFIPAANASVPPSRLGPWAHGDPPAALASWLPAEGYQGTLCGTGDPTQPRQLIVRAVRPARGRAGNVGHVIADVVIDEEVIGRLREKTGVKGGAIQIGQAPARASGTSAADPEAGRFILFKNSVTFLDCRDWVTGADAQAFIAIRYSMSELWDRLSGAQSASLRGVPLGNVFLAILAVVALLFLIIQGVALLMGLALARSITSSIHELFTGTERVRAGDFTHRISIYTNDQLGELAGSFNQMTGSIEGLLQTAAEKKRMEEELRIARQIQMSLLPRGTLDVPGLTITALCVPAREVGGDYYDFFHLTGNRLGMLIADVAGKGTSAALYMAELKGLVLALSQSHSSPRSLLLEVNRIISENLDSRSFITMTYAVIDMDRGTMTYCRAGHTPLVFMGGPRSPSGPGALVLTPSGMVVGLRFPGAAEKFEELLEEHRLDLSVGDVIVLYTDGITEAMNAESDLFGEARLSSIVEEHGHLESGELRERILREIEAFVAGADQHDDMTMILVKVEKAFKPAGVLVGAPS
jgi:phosphoserine phosphatase RsbU/P